MSLYWAAKYVNDMSSTSFFNRTDFSEYQEKEQVPNMPGLVGELFNDGSYDSEACRVLEFLGEMKHRSYFHKALTLINDDDNVSVYVGSSGDHIQIMSEEDVSRDMSLINSRDKECDATPGEFYLNEYDEKYKRMTLTELKQMM